MAGLVKITRVAAETYTGIDTVTGSPIVAPQDAIVLVSQDCADTLLQDNPADWDLIANSKVGDLGALDTTAKTDAVTAINEVFALATAAEETTVIGDLATLSTTAKNTLVAALNEIRAGLVAETDGASGGNFVAITPVSGVGDENTDTVQEFIEALDAKIKAVTDGAAGADYVGMTPIALTGAAATAQAVVEALVARLIAVTDSASGADAIGMTAVTGVTGATVQAVIEWVAARLQAVTDAASGADFIGATVITELGAAATVQSQLEALSAGKVAGSAVSLLVQDLPGVLLNTKLMNGWVPGFAGKIAKFDFCVGQTPASTAGADLDLTVSIGATPVTGGTLTLTTDTCDTIGEVTSVAPSAANAFSATDAISIECTEIAQAFAEGWGTLILSLEPA